MTQRLTNHKWTLGFAFLLLLGWPGGAWTQEIVELGDRSANCHEDAACINRLHPAIPMAGRAHPGATIVLHTRNAIDFDLDPQRAAGSPRRRPRGRHRVYPADCAAYFRELQTPHYLSTDTLTTPSGCRVD